MANSFDDLLNRAKGQSAQAPDTALQEQNQLLKSQVQSSVYATRDKDPGAVVEAYKISEREKIPYSFVEKNLDKVKKTVATNKFNYDALVEKARGTSKFLAKPENAALAKDDVDALQQVEAQVSRFKPYKADPVTIHKEYAQAAQGGLKQLEASAYLLGAAYGKVDIDTAAEAVADSFKRQQELRAKAPDYVKDFEAVLETEGGDIDRAAKKFLSGYDEYKRGNVLNALKNYAVGAGQTVGETLDLAVKSLKDNPRAVGYLTIESLANSFPSIAAGIAGGAAGFAAGPAAPVAVPVGIMGGTFGGSLAVEVGATLQQELSERGIDVTDPQAIAGALRDPQLLAEMKSRAERKGLGTAGVDAIFSLFAGQLLGKAGKGVLKKTAGVAADVGLQATGEAVSEAAGQVAKERGDLGKVNWGEAVAEGIISLGHSIGEVGVGAARTAGAAAIRSAYSKKPERAVEQVAEDTVKSVKTVQDLQAIDEAKKKIRESKNIKDVPSKVKELIDTVTGGDEQAAVYFQTDDFDSYWNRKGRAPVEAAAEIMGDGGKAYLEAKSTGQVLEMSVSQLIAQTATKPDIDDLIQITRVGVDGMSLTEAQEHIKNLPQIMDALASEALGQTEAGVSDAGIEVPEFSIEQNVTEQLMAAGLKQSDARTYAKIYGSGFNAMAERAGVSPQELFQRYGLQIRGPEQMVQLEAGQSVLEQAGEKPQVSDLGFYSKLEKQVLDKIQGKSAEVGQVQAILRDLKPEEVKWSGIEEFLKGKKKVDRQELLDFIRANSLQITEVTLADREGSIQPGDRVYTIFSMDGEGGETYFDRQRAEAAAKEDYGSGNYEIQEMEWDGETTIVDAEQNEATFGKPKFSQYTLPGGENYREVLLTLPPKSPNPVSQDEVGSIDTWKKEDRKPFKQVPTKVVFEDEEISKEFNSLKRLIKKEMPEMKPKEIERVLRTAVISPSKISETLNGDLLKSTWDRLDKFQDNFKAKQNPFPLEKVYKKDIRGERFMIVDTGRPADQKDKFSGVYISGTSIGQRDNLVFNSMDEALAALPSAADNEFMSNNPDVYKSGHFDEKNILAHVRLNDRTDADGKKVLFVEEIQSDWHQAGRKKGYKAGGQPDPDVLEFLRNETDGLLDKLIDRYNLEGPDYRDSLQKIANQQRDGVPDAPFKKTWHEFALKRILKMAVDQGYERVAWTTGEQQAERYDLSKQIQTVEYLPESRTLRAFDLNGNNVIDQFVMNETDLSDYIGKDVADKLLASKPRETGSGKKVHRVEGADLKVGGEGMKGFYDNILVKSADKLIKKFGGKVGETFIGEDDGTGKPSVWNDKKNKFEPAPKVHSLDITPALRDAVSTQGFELFQEGAKGRIRFGSDKQFNIDLLQNADPSTFLHETGHFFFEILGDLAEAPNASDQVKDDFKALLNWFGVESRNQVEVKHHEQFARGFEAYLMEGKAPSTALKKAFRRFKQWLITVYRQMRNLNVELTTEVRDVMNRLLATDAEIQEATEANNFEPLFSDPTAFGFTGKKAEQYMAAVDEARMAAEEQMTAKLMSQIERKRSSEYRKRKKAVRSEVETQVNQMPQYRVLSMLQKGTMPDGSPLPEGVNAVKLDRQTLIDMYGAEFVKNRLPRPFIYARDGGIHPDIVAEMYGFESGDAMITQILNQPPRKDMIDQMTEQRMSQEYPDLLASDEELERVALETIHNEKRAELLRLELDFLWDNYQGMAKEVIRRTIRRTPQQKFIKEQAQKILGGKVMKTIKPHMFLAAEKRAAKDAAQALMNGDFEAAYLAKEKELLNHELYKEALSLKDQTKKSLDLFKRFFKKDEDLARSRDLNFINAGRAILAEYGIGRKDKSAAEYLEELRRYDPEGYETIKALVDDAVDGAGPFKQVTADKFSEMADAVRGLWDMSKRSKEIVIEGRKLDKDAAVDELIGTIQQLGQKPNRAGYEKKATKWDQFKVGLAGFASILRRVEQWADAMDAGEARGAFKRLMFEPIAEATSQYRLEKKQVLQKYLDAVKGVEKTITREPISAPELGYTFDGKQELLGSLMHVGNDSNKSKLLLGRGWATMNADGSLNTTKWDSFLKRLHDTGQLVKADWDFIQNVWNIFEETKVGAQRAHYDMYGFYFSEITANEVTTPFGTYRGGYAPAIPDSELVNDQAIRNEQDQLEKMGNSFMFPTAGRGFTKKRVEQYTVPLQMDLGLVPRQIDKVLRFTHIEPRVKDVARLVFDRRFRKEIDAFDKTVAGEMLVPWLQRAARQQVEIPSQGKGWQFIDRVFKTLRRNTGLNIMTANVLNTLQQVTGLSIAALDVNHKNLRNALWSYVRNPKNYTADVAAKSEFMNTRVTTNVIEIQNHIDELLLNPSKYEKLREFAAKHGYFMQSGAQSVVDVIVWGGAYDQAIAGGASEKDAVRAADKAVRGTQGSFNPEDLSAFEVGSPMFRAFTMFYSYFNMQGNILATKVQQTVSEMGLKKGAGRLMYIYIFGFMIPAVVAEAIMRAGGGDWDEDDDDSYLDDLMSIFFLSQFRTLTAFIPYAGQASNALVNTFNDKPYDDRISTSPAIGIVETMARTPKSVYDAIAEDKSKKKAAKDLLTTLGVLTGVPLAPLGKPVGYLLDIQEGRAEPSGPIDFTRGLITGRPGDNQ